MAATKTEKSYQDVYIITERIIAGIIRYSVERQDFTAIDHPKETIPGQLCMLDCGKVYNLMAPVNEVDGLDHLIGETVSIVVDGMPQADQIVAEDGSVQLDPPGKVIDVGINYPSVLRTMRPEIPGAPTIQGAFQRWSSVFVRVVATLGIRIGKQVVNFRKPTDPMPGPVAQLDDEDIKIDQLGYDRVGRITIEQRQPLQCSVIAVFGDLDVQDD